MLCKRYARLERMWASPWQAEGIHGENRKGKEKERRVKKDKIEVRGGGGEEEEERKLEEES